MKNIDDKTVDGFGDEWRKYNYSAETGVNIKHHFAEYFNIFPLHELNSNSSIGFDGGCGSGRWAKFVAPLCYKLICIDASKNALEVAKANLREHTNCEFFCASVSEMPMGDGTMDFGYSLGVIHHTPDPQEALNESRRVLKQGAPFLLYLYYRFDNRGMIFRMIWHISDLLRLFISRLPFSVKLLVCNLIAAVIYFPLARLSKLLTILGIKTTLLPLSYYQNSEFYIMKNDALDRFGTRLEMRFTRSEIQVMLETAGFELITFSEMRPHWCVLSHAK